LSIHKVILTRLEDRFFRTRCIALRKTVSNRIRTHRLRWVNCVSSCRYIPAAIMRRRRHGTAVQANQPTRYRNTCLVGRAQVVSGRPTGQLGPIVRLVSYQLGGDPMMPWALSSDVTSEGVPCEASMTPLTITLPTCCRRVVVIVTATKDDVCVTVSISQPSPYLCANSVHLSSYCYSFVIFKSRP